MTEQMRNVDHTHPFGDRSAARSFERGPTVVTDGGQDEQTEERMADVDHVPPHGEGASPVFKRGKKRQADVSVNVAVDKDNR
ncbi:hypothetical protein ACFQH2_07375 [Natronoarchaeum sp. GCM10025703]|uniref:hypothetical protein n=1 Tax=unclassified Natronoarchaeum TaxID=2620183 RepID=UPI003621C820